MKSLIILQVYLIFFFTAYRPMGQIELVTAWGKIDEKSTKKAESSFNMLELNASILREQTLEDSVMELQTKLKEFQNSDNIFKGEIITAITKLKNECKEFRKEMKNFMTDFLAEMKEMKVFMRDLVAKVKKSRNHQPSLKLRASESPEKTNDSE